MTESERIEFLIKAVAGGNASEFADRLGVNKSIVSRLRNPKYKMGIRLHIDKIMRAYPSINRSWLESGEGYPGDLTVELVKAHYEAKTQRLDSVIDHLIKKIDDLEAQLSVQKECKGQNIKS